MILLNLHLCNSSHYILSHAHSPLKITVTSVEITRGKSNCTGRNQIVTKLQPIDIPKPKSSVKNLHEKIRPKKHRWSGQVHVWKPYDSQEIAKPYFACNVSTIRELNITNEYEPRLFSKFHWNFETVPRFSPCQPSLTGLPTLNVKYQDVGQPVY